MDHSGRILLVEDLKEWQRMIKELLPEDSYRVFKVAEDLQKASDLLKHHVFDLVLLDLRMNDWDEQDFKGFKLLGQIAEVREEQGTQVIIVSAYGEPEHVREGFKKYDIADYFDKKWLKRDEFRKAVADAIEKAYEERQQILGHK